MGDQQMMKIELAAGESRQILVEGGSTLLLLSGCAEVRSPFGWLAENIHQARTQLDAENSVPVEQGGWIELTGRTAAQFVILPPDTQPLWSSLLRSLEKMLANRRLSAAK